MTAPDTASAAQRDLPSVVTGRFGGNPYQELQALQDDLMRAIRARDGLVPVAGVIGVLRLIEHVLVQEASND